MNRLDNTKENLIKIVQNVFLGEEVTLDNINIDAICNLAKYHSIEYIIYFGLKKLNIDSIPDSFKRISEVNAYKSVTQELEIPIIAKEFSKNEICFMPLKGSIMQKMYPSTEYRNMADIDILVKEEDLKKAGIALKNIGYVVDTLGGNHDTYTKKPYLHIEVHRALIDELYELSKYYNNIWEDNRIYNDKDDKYHYYLTDNDFYIFMICHAAKHFSHGGTGFRTIIDEYIYLNNKDNLDFNYINEELKKNKLDKFEKLLRDSANYIFKHEVKDNINDVLMFIDFILSCGTYGNTKNSSTIGVIDDGSKEKHIWVRLFPPYSVMKRRNPSLKKAPFLLPWFYFTRLLKALFHFRRYKKSYDEIRNVNEDDILRINKIKEITGVE